MAGNNAPTGYERFMNESYAILEGETEWVSLEDLE